MRHPVIIAGLTSLAMLRVASAQDQAPAEREIPGKLQSVEGEIKDSEARRAALVASLEAALKAEAELSTRLVNQANLVKTQEQALAKTESRLKDLKLKTAEAAIELAAKQDVLSDILAGLQRLQQNPPPALVVKSGDALAAVRSAMLFGVVVPELRGEAEAVRTRLAALEELRSRLSAETATRIRELASLDQGRKDTLSLIAEKKALARASRTDIKEEEKRARELAEKAKTLKQLLDGLEAARQAATEKEKEAEQARLEAEKRLAAQAIRPHVAFSQAKGSLNYPAQGHILKTFGEDSGLGGQLDGIVIATPPAAQVTAPADGKVEFAGLFRSYGQLLILNAGEGHLVLLAGLDRILVQPGQQVLAGEPVGLMGEKPASLTVANGLTNQPDPVLYVEFRKNGAPVDSQPWWTASKQEAMR